MIHMDLKHGTWLVGVSGGQDSMALLSMCLEEGIKVSAAHVNYHHRLEADEEEAYVRAFCASYHIECYVRSEPFEYEGNFEAAARNWRYDFFAHLVTANNLEGVLIAHQQDDLLETYLMQEEKGIIPEFYGLKEERRINGIRVVRPLLGKTREELRNYCEDRGITYFTDSTNQDRSYTRNRIRMDMVEGMSSTERELLVSEIRLKNAQLSERRCRIDAYWKQGRMTRELYCSLEEEDRLEALVELLEEKGLRYSRNGLKELDHVITTRKDFVTPCKPYVLTLQKGKLALCEPAKPYSYQVNTLEELRQLKSPYFRVEDGTPGIYALSVTEEDFPITVRSVQAGDAIRMRFGMKAVHRFFIDRRIPLYARGFWPVVCDCRGEVILVPGLGCDTSHYSVCPNVSVIQLVHC